MKLLGRGWQNIMYTRGWDELMPRAESLRAEVEEEEEEGLETIRFVFNNRSLNMTFIVERFFLSRSRKSAPENCFVNIEKHFHTSWI